jgi:hypothetical protein
MARVGPEGGCLVVFMAGEEGLVALVNNLLSANAGFEPTASGSGGRMHLVPPCTPSFRIDDILPFQSKVAGRGQ